LAQNPRKSLPNDFHPCIQTSNINILPFKWWNIEIFTLLPFVGAWKQHNYTFSFLLAIFQNGDSVPGTLLHSGPAGTAHMLQPLSSSCWPMLQAPNVYRSGRSRLIFFYFCNSGLGEPNLLLCGKVRSWILRPQSTSTIVIVQVHPYSHYCNHMRRCWSSFILDSDLIYVPPIHISRLGNINPG